MNALNISLGIFGINEMIPIVIIVLLIFGGKKIPEFMRGLGTGIKEFKSSMNEDSPKNNKETSKIDEVKSENESK